MRVSKKDLAMLQMFGPDTRSLTLPRDTGKRLEKKGLVEWMPAVWGSHVEYAITDAGRSLLSSTAE